MNRICVPTDFSQCAENALNLAISIALKNKAEIHVIHSFNANNEIIATDFSTPFQGVPGSMSAEQLNQQMDEWFNAAKNRLSKIKNELIEKGIKTETHIVDSGHFKGISELVSELKGDLVVMGSHGSSGMEETFIGSNTQRFIRYSPAPVLVVKKESQHSGFHNVAFCSTFSNEGEKAIYLRYRDLFGKYPALTHFLLVNTPSQFLTTPQAQMRMNDFLMEAWPSNYETHVYDDLTVEEGIMNFAESHDVDMLVIATHGFTGLRRIFSHSTTESLVNHSDIPVLTFTL